VIIEIEFEAVKKCDDKEQARAFIDQLLALPLVGSLTVAIVDTGGYLNFRLDSDTDVPAMLADIDEYLTGERQQSLL
jgi:hypothetical protein